MIRLLFIAVLASYKNINQPVSSTCVKYVENDKFLKVDDKKDDPLLYYNSILVTNDSIRSGDVNVTKQYQRLSKTSKGSTSCIRFKGILKSTTRNMSIAITCSSKLKERTVKTTNRNKSMTTQIVTEVKNTPSLFSSNFTEKVLKTTKSCQDKLLEINRAKSLSPLKNSNISSKSTFETLKFNTKISLQTITEKMTKPSLFTSSLSKVIFKTTKCGQDNNCLDITEAPSTALVSKSTKKASNTIKSNENKTSQINLEEMSTPLLFSSNLLVESLKTTLSWQEKLFELLKTDTSSTLENTSRKSTIETTSSNDKITSQILSTPSLFSSNEVISKCTKSDQDDNWLEITEASTTPLVNFSTSNRSLSETTNSNEDLTSSIITEEMSNLTLFLRNLSEVILITSKSDQEDNWLEVSDTNCTASENSTSSKIPLETTNSNDNITSQIITEEISTISSLSSNLSKEIFKSIKDRHNNLLEIVTEEPLTALEQLCTSTKRVNTSNSNPNIRSQNMTAEMSTPSLFSGNLSEEALKTNKSFQDKLDIFSTEFSTPLKYSSTGIKNTVEIIDSNKNISSQIITAEMITASLFSNKLSEENFKTIKIRRNNRLEIFINESATPLEYYRSSTEMALDNSNNENMTAQTIAEDMSTPILFPSYCSEETLKTSKSRLDKLLEIIRPKSTTPFEKCNKSKKSTVETSNSNNNLTSQIITTEISTISFSSNNSSKVILKTN